MKNRKIIFSALLLTILTVSFLPMLVGAAPSSNPPAGLPDAEFNSVYANGAISNPGLDIAGNGFLSNPFGNVVVNDSLDVRSSIGNYTGGIAPLILKDSQGIQIADFFGTVGLSIAADGTITSPDGSIKIYGEIVNAGTLPNVITNLQSSFFDVHGAIKNTTQPYVYIADDLFVAGKITASGGMGTFTKRIGVEVPVAAGGTATAYANCNSDEIVVSCGYWNGHYGVEPAVVEMEADRCRVAAKNTNGFASNIEARAMCFDPTS